MFHIRLDMTFVAGVVNVRVVWLHPDVALVASVLKVLKD